MIYALIFFGVVILDQVTKAVVDLNNCQIPVIKDIFLIFNTRNPGAAFGMLADEPTAIAIFTTLTVLSMIAIAVYLIIRKRNSRWLNVSLAFIASGAIGNFIDRIAFKEVRDFLYVTFFANFNVADIAVTVGGIMIFIYFFFLDKDAIFKSKKVKDETDEN